MIEPLVRDQHVSGMSSNFGASRAGQVNSQQQLGMSPLYNNNHLQAYEDPMQLKKVQQENVHVSKLVHSLEHNDTDTVYEMLIVARNHITQAGSGPQRVGQTLAAVVFAALRLARRVFDAEQGSLPQPDGAVTSNDDGATTREAANDAPKPDGCDAKEEEKSSETAVDGVATVESKDCEERVAQLKVIKYVRLSFPVKFTVRFQVY